MTAATTPGERWRLGYRPALDGLRGVAILLVVAGHLAIPGLDSGGWAGVPLFFALSGFLITVLLLDEHARSGGIDLRAFYRRRALRLLPALIVFLIVVTIVRHWFGSPNAATDALAVLFYVGNWARAISGDVPAGLAHTWTLAVEEQFYIFWPPLLIGLLTLTNGRLRWIVCILLVGALMSAALRFVLPLERSYVGTDTRADALLAGAALAAVFHKRGAWIPSGLMVAVASAGMWLVSAPPSTVSLYATELRFGLPLVTVCSVILVAAAASRASRLLAWTPLVWLGKVSYGLYLWHYALFSAALAVGVSTWLMLPVAMAFTLVSYRYVERPFLLRKSARPDLISRLRNAEEDGAEGRRRPARSRTNHRVTRC